MNPNAIVILLILWAGSCVALPLWAHKVSPQGRIALPLLALFEIWLGATMPLEPHGPGCALAAVLSFPLGWIGHWLIPGHSTLAFAFVLVAGALSAAINFYLLAWMLPATCCWLGGIGFRLRAQRLGSIFVALSGLRVLAPMDPTLGDGEGLENNELSRYIEHDNRGKNTGIEESDLGGKAGAGR